MAKVPNDVEILQKNSTSSVRCTNVTDDVWARAYSKPRTLKTIVKCITRMIRPVDGPGTMYLTNIHTLQVHCLLTIYSSIAII